MMENAMDIATRPSCVSIIHSCTSPLWGEVTLIYSLCPDENPWSCISGRSSKHICIILAEYRYAVDLFVKYLRTDATVRRVLSGSESRYAFKASLRGLVCILLLSYPRCDHQHQIVLRHGHGVVSGQFEDHGRTEEQGLLNERIDVLT